ncbi:MAG TPA: hypothetical protein VMH02_12710 [Verrucomicrobiae bacterium]|nr:hypothetical protein [Verrucomicrobiae bacterium]
METTLRRSLWIPGTRESPKSGSTSFSIRMRWNEHDREAIEGRFALALQAIAGRRGAYAFTWTHRSGFALPSMRGEAVARRLGPVLVVSVTASYEVPAGPAARLFGQAVGERLARKTFDRLSGAIRVVFGGATKRSEPALRGHSPVG